MKCKFQCGYVSLRKSNFDKVGSILGLINNGNSKVNNMTKYLIALTTLFIALFATATNTQNVTISGGVVNKSDGTGSHAAINVGSTVGRVVGSNNNQTVTVNGSLVNTATGGNSKAAINLGSSVNHSGSNNQVVSVGTIVNSASGGGKSEVNIGSVVKD